MLASNRQCRRNVMEELEDDKLRTIDCLRGRLLAERVASRTAKEEADKMAKRLQELERKLAEEIKFRDRAQKRLKRAMKKLESLKASDGFWDQMEMPLSSVSSSSSQCFSGQQALQGETSGSVTSNVTRMASTYSESEDIPEASLGESTHRRASLEQSRTSTGTENYKYEEAPKISKDKGFSPEEGDISDLRDESSGKDCESRDNMLALVPVTNLPGSEVCKPKMTDNVKSVLLALSNVKEQLLRSLKIAAICQEAGMHAVRRNRYVILPKDFEKGYQANVKKPGTDFDFYK